MLTAGTDQLTDTIGELKQAASEALAEESVEQFVEFENCINQVEAFVRELQQSMWADKAKTAIKHLEKGLPLTPDDVEAVRTFLISDAERYIAHENNYPDWKRELERLMEEVGRRAQAVDPQTIGDLRGVLIDGIRLVPDLRNYVEQKQRIAKFEHALDSLDQQSSAMLVRLLKEQLSTARR